MDSKGSALDNIFVIIPWCIDKYEHIYLSRIETVWIVGYIIAFRIVKEEI